jgi:VCBS repeat-containing protein
MPSILTGIGFDGTSETVTVTVDGLTDTFEIIMLPAPLDKADGPLK